jgi:hypothetical protein
VTAAGSDDEVALVVVQAGRMLLAVDASRVLEICSERHWSGEPPVDLARAGGAPLDTSEGAGEARVVVVRRRGGRQPVALRARGAVRVQRVARAAALELPRVMRSRVRWVAAVVIADEGSAILVVDPDELAADAGPTR